MIYQQNRDFLNVTIVLFYFNKAPQGRIVLYLIVFFTSDVYTKRDSKENSLNALEPLLNDLDCSYQTIV